MATLFVGNLRFRSEADDIRQFFAEYGHPVGDINIMYNKDTGESRGFAFVEIDDQIMDQAIEDCDGVELDGRALRVNEARPRPSRGGSREQGKRQSYGRR